MAGNLPQCSCSENTGLSQTPGSYPSLITSLTPEALCLMDLNPSWRGQRMWMLSSPSSRGVFFVVYLFTPNILMLSLQNPHFAAPQGYFREWLDILKFLTMSRFGVL